ncbi:GNAT family N-acetyltransferase [Reinekea blandensis]|uniref:Acetyltransferase, GNAT family protein n=1 Tax=Reinekea blandensis MED297 TaxID=314283 RepID=A4BG52_9GAMM|nr:GNAT family N-acetyltransferase [Reinekea blandensis]EAR08847.1 acetyltransferase, GNAT family protein [Reinekea sp. MED297] [Reinekea blandensis MED297]
MTVTIVPVDYRNAEQTHDLMSLLNNYASDAMGGGQSLPAETLAALPEKLAAVPGAFSLMVLVDGQPAGFANCFMGFSTFKAKPLVNIHDLAVNPDFRGQGLSLKLLEAIEAKARERHCCKITLEVLSGNEVAKGAYIKAGFDGYELDPKTGQALFWEKPLR